MQLKGKDTLNPTSGLAGFSLERHWTEFGQRLDFLPSLCPTNHQQTAPDLGLGKP